MNIWIVTFDKELPEIVQKKSNNIEKLKSNSNLIREKSEFQEWHGVFNSDFFQFPLRER